MAAANIANLYANAVLMAVDPDNKNNDPIVKIKRFMAPIIINDEIADVLITQKISTAKGTNRIYSLEVDEIISAEKVQGEVRPAPGPQTSGQSLTLRNYPVTDINKLNAKHEKIKSFLQKKAKYNFTAPFERTVAGELWGRNWAWGALF